jgi:hypothetical protein
MPILDVTDGNPHPWAQSFPPVDDEDDVKPDMNSINTFNAESNEVGDFKQPEVLHDYFNNPVPAETKETKPFQFSYNFDYASNDFMNEIEAPSSTNQVENEQWPEVRASSKTQEAESPSSSHRHVSSSIIQQWRSSLVAKFAGLSQKQLQRKIEGTTIPPLLLRSRYRH